MASTPPNASPLLGRGVSEARQSRRIRSNPANLQVFAYPGEIVSPPDGPAQFA